MVIGIPRAGMYYRYGVLWERFLHELGIEYILSCETNKGILDKGSALMADESCLSSKIYMGHVDWLMDRCDCLFVPWLSNFGKDGINCTRFRAYHALISNIYRERSPKLITYAIDYSGTQDMKHAGDERTAFMSMSGALNRSKKEIETAYVAAKLFYEDSLLKKNSEGEELADGAGIKILMVGHDYSIYDAYIGRPILNAFRKSGMTVIDANLFDRQKAQKAYLQFSDSTLPWTVSRELLGGIAHYHDRVDGLVLLTCFPCGPDSLVNEVIKREVTDKPILYLLQDGQDALAGVETRIESFVDILNFRKNGVK
ncbi:MAG: acyl-CoA dehydratase activase-related protein [Clostridia bacterium]|nr:acyl-CoA dehydratase activase-related protein [Clostridia bacterium]